MEILSELLFERLRLDPAAIRIVEGWFQETLTAHPARPIALLHLDGDWYESVKLGLDILYDRANGGADCVDQIVVESPETACVTRRIAAAVDEPLG